MKASCLLPIVLGNLLSLSGLLGLSTAMVASAQPADTNLGAQLPLLRRGNTEAHRIEYRRRTAAYEQGKREWEQARREWLAAGSPGSPVPGTMGTRAHAYKFEEPGSHICDVCQEELADDGGLVRKTGPCKHVLHHTCLEEWEKTSWNGEAPTCPRCRGPLFVTHVSATKVDQRLTDLDSSILF